MTKRWAIGMDIGGTNLKAGIVAASGELITSRVVPLTDRTVDGVRSLMVREVQGLQRETPGPITALGIGFPGIVEQGRGVVAAAPNLEGWDDVPVVDQLQEDIRLPIVIDNEVNFAALAELHAGAGRGHRDFVLLTLGTGIGCGMILGGKLYRGASGFAGEVGHMVIDVAGLPCGCGGRGCWERYVAAGSFAPSTPEATARLAAAGDAAARATWEKCGRFLGVGIHSLINVLGITTFIIGGGMARSFPFFVQATREEIAKRAYRQNRDRLQLIPSTLDNTGGVIGAALAAFEQPQVSP